MPLDLVCPTCAAGIGAPCRSSRGAERAPHTDRVQLAALRDQGQSWDAWSRLTRPLPRPR
jgi:hypothetical protein